MKKLIKTYLWLILIIVELFGIFGFGLPYLFSQPSDIAVLLGVVLMIISLPTITYTINKFMDSIKKINK